MISIRELGVYRAIRKSLQQVSDKVLLADSTLSSLLRLEKSRKTGRHQITGPVIEAMRICRAFAWI